MLPLILLLLARSSETAPHTGRHIALVIGNGAYGKAPLAKAVQTAKQVQSAFASLGFETSLLANAGFAETQRTMAVLASTVTPKDTVVVYYHGYLLRGDFEDILLPIDFPPGLKEFWIGTGFSVKSIIESLEATAGTFVLVLDAPTDHPFDLGKDRAKGRFPTKAPKNGVVILASEPGKAIAGNEEGVFASIWREQLGKQATTGTPSSLFAEVRPKVREKTGGKLSPWISIGSRPAGETALRSQGRGLPPQVQETWEDARFELVTLEPIAANRPFLRDRNRKAALGFFDADRAAAVEQASKQPQKGEFETIEQYRARTGLDSPPTAVVEEKIRVERSRLETIFEDETGDTAKNLHEMRTRQFSGPCKAEWVSYDADRKLLRLFVAGADRLFDMAPADAQSFKPRSALLRCAGGLNPETVTVSDPEGKTTLYERPWEMYRAGVSGVTAAKPVTRFEPVFPALAAKARVRNAVIELALLVDETGAPTSIRVIRGAGFGFDEAAVSAARKWRFQPGMREGKPVVTEVPLRLSFSLRN